jgi:hypothetical protein
MAIFFSRPLTLTINSLDIDFLSVDALDTRSTGALSALKRLSVRCAGICACDRFAQWLMEVAGRM